MSIVDVAYRTITCNGAGCENAVTVERGKEAEAAEKTPWFKTLRIVQTSQGRNFCYCSDQCELASVAEGLHNPEEPKKIIEAPSSSLVQQAAAAAKAAEAATKAIKAGQPVTLHQGS